MITGKFVNPQIRS